MAETPSTMVALGTALPAFSLPDLDGRIVNDRDFADATALVVAASKVPVTLSSDPTAALSDRCSRRTISLAAPYLMICSLPRLCRATHTAAPTLRLYGVSPLALR